ARRRLHRHERPHLEPGEGAQERRRQPLRIAVMANGTRATAALDRAGIAHGLHTYDYAASVDSKGVAAEQALGIAPARVFKTLMAWVDRQPLIAVIPSDQRLSLKKLAAQCGGKHAQMMDIPEAEKRSGYKVGGI